MRAVVFEGRSRIKVRDDVGDPKVQDDRDAVVRVTRAAICGSDLHPYRGEIPGFERGTVLGHEFVGVVEDAGPEAGVLPGDRVVASDLVACGRCERCARGWHYHCPQATLFGYSNVVGTALDGGQAERVRVPFADVVLMRCPDDLSDEEALFTGDVLTTGLTAAKLAAIPPGDVVAVVGAGAVGLFAAQCALALGAGAVVFSDRSPLRRAAAERLGFRAAAPGDAADVVASLRGSPGAPSVIEAVGSGEALRGAIALAAPRAHVVVVGAHSSPSAPFPAGTAFVRELSIVFAVGDPIATRDEAFALVTRGKVSPIPIISHRLPLDDAAEGYRLLDSGEATKVVLVP